VFSFIYTLISGSNAECKQRVMLFLADTAQGIDTELAGIFTGILINDIKPAKFGLMTFDTNAQYRVSAYPNGTLLEL